MALDPELKMTIDDLNKELATIRTEFQPKADRSEVRLLEERITRLERKILVA